MRYSCTKVALGFGRRYLSNLLSVLNEKKMQIIPSFAFAIVNNGFMTNNLVLEREREISSSSTWAPCALG